MTAAYKLATYEDLVRLPDGVRAELCEGSIEVQPSAAMKHSRSQGYLRGSIGRGFDDDDGFGGPGGWWIALPVDIRFTPLTVLRPDLAGWRRDRLVDPWDTLPIDTVPDWICEVVSPSSVARDRVTKRRIYLEHAVPYYWICDPDSRTLEVLRRDDALNAWVEQGVYSDGDCVRLPPFEALELEVTRLFPPRT
jgi:Uma2 family endonuclease